MNKRQLRQRQFRIEIKSDDVHGKIRYEEPFSGLSSEATRRAQIMWARTSYVANVKEKTSNRDVYCKLEVWDTESQSWRIVWEKRGKLPRNAPAPAAT